MGERQSESATNHDHNEESVGKLDEAGPQSGTEKGSDAAEREQDRQLESGEENPT